MANSIGKHKSIFIMNLGALAFVMGGFVWAFVVLGTKVGGSAGVGPFILHFNDISGITQVGSVMELVFAGAFSVAAVIANFAVALEFDRRDRVLGKLMAAITLVAAALLFMACAAILNVN